MAKSLKFGNVLLCEHAVRGEGGLATLINVYSGNILVQEMPSRLLIGMFVEHTPQQDAPYDLILEFLLDRKAIGKIVAQIDSSVITEIGAITLPVMDVHISSPCTFEIQASAEGFSKKTILQKRIELKDNELGA